MKKLPNSSAQVTISPGGAGLSLHSSSHMDELSAEAATALAQYGLSLPTSGRYEHGDGRIYSIVGETRGPVAAAQAYAALSSAGIPAHIVLQVGTLSEALFQKQLVLPSGAYRLADIEGVDFDGSFDVFKDDMADHEPKFVVFLSSDLPSAEHSYQEILAHPGSICSIEFHYPGQIKEMIDRMQGSWSGGESQGGSEAVGGRKQ